MAIETVGTPTTKGPTGTTMTVPSGLQEGDVVFVMLFSDFNVTPAAPTGFENGQYGSNDIDWGWFYKVMGATPITSVSLTHSSCQYTSGICFALRGIDPANVLDVATPSRAIGSSGMPNAPSITPITDGAMVLAFGFLDDDLVTATAPSGYTMIKYHQEDNAFFRSTAMVAYKILASAGAEDPGVFGGGGSDAWVACSCAVRPIKEAQTGLEMGCNF